MLMELLETSSVSLLPASSLACPLLPLLPGLLLTTTTSVLRIVEDSEASAPANLPTRACARIDSEMSFVLATSATTTTFMATVSKVVGCGEGVGVGSGVGARLGFGDGAREGTGVGIRVGVGDGSGVGAGEGVKEGTGVGIRVGTGLGLGVGINEGTGVGIRVGTGLGLGVP